MQRQIVLDDASQPQWHLGEDQSTHSIEKRHSFSLTRMIGAVPWVCRIAGQLEERRLIKVSASTSTTTLRCETCAQICASFYEYPGLTAKGDSATVL